MADNDYISETRVEWQEMCSDDDDNNEKKVNQKTTRKMKVTQ